MTTVPKEKSKRPGLSAYEQETTINFNKAEDIAYIFTYEKSWQQHLEGKLGLKPTMDNGYGGKEYQLPKSRIPMPRAKRVMSAEQRQRLVRTLKNARVKRQGVLLDKIVQNPVS